MSEVKFQVPLVKRKLQFEYMTSVRTKHNSRAQTTLSISCCVRSICLPNTNPAGQELKSRAFVVVGVLCVGLLPAALLVLLNLLIVCKLMQRHRPGDNLTQLNKKEKNTKVCGWAGD